MVFLIKYSCACVGVNKLSDPYISVSSLILPILPRTLNEPRLWKCIMLNVASCTLTRQSGPRIECR